jgi:hypothetical protein
MSVGGVGSGSPFEGTGGVEQPAADPQGEQTAASTSEEPSATTPAATSTGGPTGNWSTGAHLLSESTASWRETAAAAAGRTAPKPDAQPKAPPKFDRWNLTPEVKDLFLRIENATDAKQIEATVNELVKEHKVPKAVVQEVVDANKGFFQKAWPLVKGGSWKTAQVAEDGAITSTFSLDPKKKELTFETAAHRTHVRALSSSGGRLEHERKDGGWAIGADFNDERKKKTSTGGLDFTIGDPKAGETQIRGEGIFKKDTAGGAVSLRMREGDETRTSRLGYAQGKLGGTVSGSHTVKDGKDVTGGSVNVHVGDKVGADGKATVSRGGYGVDAGAHGNRTSTDAYESSTIGVDAKVRLGDRGGRGANAPLTLSGKATGSSKTTVESGSETETLDLSGGASFGRTKVTAGYKHSTDTSAGKVPLTETYKAGAGHTWVTKEDSVTDAVGVKLDGTVTTRPGDADDVRITGKVTHSETEGSGKTKTVDSESVTITGGHGTAGVIGKETTAPKAMYTDDKSRGGYGAVDVQIKRGPHTVDLGVAGGATDETSMVGANAGYAKGKELDVDAAFGLAMGNEGARVLMKSTTQIALGSKMDLSVGGQLEVAPGDPEFEPLWQLYAGYGFEFDKGSKLTLRVGMNTDGQRVAYVPQAVLAIGKQVQISTTANLSPTADPSVGGTVKLGPVSIFGGYGNPTALGTSYMGTPGMKFPGMTQDDVLGTTFGPGQQPQGFVGVKLDVLKLMRKLQK